jgi:hypothetical protein
MKGLSDRLGFVCGGGGWRESWPHSTYGCLLLYSSEVKTLIIEAWCKIT